MKLIDLSEPVFHGCQGWPEDPPVRVRALATHQRDGWQVEEITFSAHTGTHIDAPRHQWARGKSITQLPLETFTGPAVIADLRSALSNQPLMSGHLRQALLDADLRDKIVLLATRRAGRGRSSPSKAPPFLTPEGARWLAKQGVRAVGIDQCSIGGLCEPFNSRTHEALLRRGVWILEGLRIPAQVFRICTPAVLWALPLALKAMGGAPCRAVLVITP